MERILEVGDDRKEMVFISNQAKLPTAINRKVPPVADGDIIAGDY